ncbi:TonB-dependent receptor plug domain-containing protein [Porticoccus sp.]|uniref:TonB-dependent receptor plug domain-containing protein n=1 Tax=Porticoccus sp. TaxID=2024853 RepID=UPI003F697E4E
MFAPKPLALPLALAISGTGALAQIGALEEVIVTAQKRSESLQDVPVAVNAFSSDTIQEAGINDTSDLAVMTPSLNANANSSPFTTRLTIRGIGAARTPMRVLSVSSPSGPIWNNSKAMLSQRRQLRYGKINRDGLRPPG